MNKIIRHTIIITLTESWTFIWDGVGDAVDGADDVTSTHSISQQRLSDSGGETIDKEPETDGPQTGTSKRTTGTLSQTRSRHRRKRSSKLPKGAP